MQLDNLLALRRSAFVATTDSDHELLVHPNLARRIQLSGTTERDRQSEAQTGLVHHSDRRIQGQFNRWLQHLPEYNF